MDCIQKIPGGTIISPKGYQTDGLHCGIKYKKNDLGIIYSVKPASVAAVYTLNKIKAAPLYVTQESIETNQTIQAIIVNSGNANACTGEQGDKDARTMRKTVANQFSLPEHYVAVASTGVIGVPLPIKKIEAGIAQLQPEQAVKHAEAFNGAILTTDTFVKSTCYKANIAGKTVTLAGSCKGSGMIKPNMATMLSFITTDLNIESNVLQDALKSITDQTFNCITVDGDTSTNDTVIVLANGEAENESLTPEHEDFTIFINLLKQVSEDLAKMIARDGEGATKLIEVEVTGALSSKEAIQIAKSIVGSSLVKTAIYGSDANWGRILAAAGYSGVDFNPNTIAASIGHIQMLKNGQPLPFSEEDAKKYLQQDSIYIHVDLKLGTESGKAWGCDLTYDYVKINASYRS